MSVQSARTCLERMPRRLIRVTALQGVFPWRTSSLVERLRKGGAVWNGWRRANKLYVEEPLSIDLTGADLREVDVSGANLSSANLCEADLCRATLIVIRRGVPTPIGTISL